MKVPPKSQLKKAIIETLKKQGYRVRGGVIKMPKDPTKDDYRQLHTMAVAKKLEKSGPGVKRYEDDLIQYIADGSDVEPSRIEPKLVLIERGSVFELLFRYTYLHWSIPVSAGYGRRIRFAVIDESNGKLIGIFGLCDPVYSIGARDKWIGWDRETKKDKLYHTMDAFVMGAVPPYSYLLGGKLVAMLACSNTVRSEFRKKYGGKKTLISGKTRQPYLTLLTTASALGRSSVYNRLKVDDHTYWHSIGFTQGSGEFHFSNGVYDKLRAYVEENCVPTAKHSSWGEGFRNKREVIRKGLAELGLSADLIYHGIKREVFAAPLAKKALQFLRGEIMRPCFYDWSAERQAELCIERWMFPRSKRKPEYKFFDKSSYRLWENGE